MGGQIAPTVPKLHYFAEDGKAIAQRLQRILARASTTLYVGHGGPLATRQVAQQFARISERLHYVASAAT